MSDIWVIKVLYEKNADDGISYFTDKNELAEAVAEAENAGGDVQVFRCVPVEHEVYSARVAIEIFDTKMSDLME